MYKLLIVDDEALICQGLDAMIHWEHLPLTKSGMAHDGIEAMKSIENDLPDIIITDVKMPEMDGLELIKEVSIKYPNIHFIVFSGHDEFEYAHKAMQYGVKHYLLKPSSDNELNSVLTELIDELNQKNNQLLIHKALLENITEHSFGRFLLGDEFGKQEWEYLNRLIKLKIDLDKGYLILFNIGTSIENYHTFALNNIINEVLDVNNIILRTTINEESILVINKTDLFDLKQKISLIKAKFFDFYTIDTTIFLTPVHDIKSLPESYSQLHRYIKTHLYFVKGKIVEANEFTRLLNKEVSYLNYDFSPLSKALKEGHEYDAIQLLDTFFTQLKHNHYTKDQVQLSTLELLNELLSHIPATSRVNYLNQFLNGINSTHLDVIHHQLSLFIQEIIQLYNEKNMLKYSPLINDIIKIIMHEISNPKLSLKWIAENMLYMNRDYLSKTFKKETGISFSTFLMNYRMDKACKMIADADENRITDIAEKIGFGNNPAYFSRAFKKYTGMNPSQYKEKE
jgi:two-component system response regulator YesN